MLKSGQVSTYPTGLVSDPMCKSWRIGILAVLGGYVRAFVESEKVQDEKRLVVGFDQSAWSLHQTDDERSPGQSIYTRSVDCLSIVVVVVVVVVVVGGVVVVVVGGVDSRNVVKNCFSTPRARLWIALSFPPPSKASRVGQEGEAELKEVFTTTWDRFLSF